MIYCAYHDKLVVPNFKISLANFKISLVINKKLLSPKDVTAG